MVRLLHATGITELKRIMVCDTRRANTNTVYSYLFCSKIAAIIALVSTSSGILRNTPIRSADKNF